MKEGTVSFFPEGMKASAHSRFLEVCKVSGQVTFLWVSKAYVSLLPLQDLPHVRSERTDNADSVSDV